MESHNTYNIFENFEGIRKQNARYIFGILLIIIILDAWFINK